MTYRGKDCAEVFCERLEEDVRGVYNNHIKHVIPMKPLTEIQHQNYALAVNCHICEKPFTDGEERVNGHCHLTGQHRGPAHSICNLNFKIPNFIPVFLHNFSGYDAHLFIKTLAKIYQELLPNIDMIHFIRKGIRGSVSQCSKRYMSKYDASKPTSFINYQDATNLYGKALSASLPLNNFKFLNPKDIEKLDILNIPGNSENGYILEVDLSYPEELHNQHNDLPFCPENIIPPGSKQPKLIPT